MHSSPVVQGVFMLAGGLNEHAVDLFVIDLLPIVLPI